jgi:antibiotic biosynthesis monooxygenase (ABM) superfamily enzyme
MNWHVRFEEEVRRRHPGAGMWYTRVSRQPSWVTKTALLAALLVVVVPIILLTLAAIVIGLICFTALSLIASAWRFISSPFSSTRPPKNDGRRNVQIIDRR